MSIGIFDSGIGGLTVFKEVAENFPKADIYYLGDTARVPYGNKSKETIVRYSIECATYLYHNFNVDVLIIACNTASSYALETLKKILPIPVIGVVRPGAEAAVKYTKNKKVGVIGTVATVRSNSYEKELKNIDPSLEIYQKPCPLFVPLVEEGWIDNEIARLTVKEYLQELIDKGIDTLILGCTHYPLLKNTIKSLYPNINIVDSSIAIVDHIKSLNIEFNGSGKREIFITDESHAFDNFRKLLIGDAKTKKIELSDLCSL
ncbi:MAG: glutamate racemase [Sulfurihydrogenibium sp.]|uniref:glutamate racemase n=1 Tax=Sulfurihydrogenibium sp. TaxID=2053621 RepID=UPI000CB9902F|nr:MAG: glutamate racemase [Sulfurihydrogenibium sp.]PMP77933.1 MAG: glutamate racemase [Sulfurihydrogenibium sp.]